MILRNIDALFERPHMSAVGHMRFPDKRDWIGLNSGVMVVVPRDGLCEALERHIPEAAATRPIFGDQDVIQIYYNDWSESADLHLDEGYNIYIGCVDYYAKKLDYSIFGKKNKIHVVHFIGPQKP